MKGCDEGTAGGGAAVALQVVGLAQRLQELENTKA